MRTIEACEFVSPKWVPQMANSRAVIAGIVRRPGMSYLVLVPNLKNFEVALAAGVDEIAVFGTASESFSRTNMNAVIAESLERFVPVVEATRAARARTRLHAGGHPMSIRRAGSAERRGGGGEVALQHGLLRSLARWNRCGYPPPPRSRCWKPCRR